MAPAKPKGFALLRPGSKLVAKCKTAKIHFFWLPFKSPLFYWGKSGAPGYSNTGPSGS